MVLAEKSTRATVSPLSPFELGEVLFRRSIVEISLLWHIGDKEFTIAKESLALFGSSVSVGSHGMSKCNNHQQRRHRRQLETIDDHLVGIDVFVSRVRDGNLHLFIYLGQHIHGNTRFNDNRRNLEQKRDLLFNYHS